MIKISRIAHHLRRASSSKLVLVSVFMLTVGGIVSGYANLNQTPVSAAALQDCDSNAIIRCGVSSAADFTAKFRQNTTGDLPAIYAHFGLTSSQISTFNTHAVMGVTTNTGLVQVGGKTVATNAQSLGRSASPGSHAITIGGKTYFQGSTSNRFLSKSLPTLVLMNGDKFVVGVIMSCANPVMATPVPVKPVPPPKPTPTPVPTPTPTPTPTFACVALTTHLVGKAEDRAFNFTVTSTTTGGAVLNSGDLNFGDGTAVTSHTPIELSSGDINHSFANEGTFTTTATLHFNVNNQVKDVNCTTVINAIPSVCAINPSLPANSPDCVETPVATPVETPVAVAPTPATIPSTGPADVFSGAMGVGSVSGAGYYWLRSRRDMIDKILGR